MTIKSNLPQESIISGDELSGVPFLPVGGTDPDFVSRERGRSAVCAVPVLGKMLPQCR